MTCECINWCRTQVLNTDHHENCPHYPSEVTKKTKEHLGKILKHFRDYCGEGDGIPEECWEDYKAAVLFSNNIEHYKKLIELETKD